MGWMGPAAWLKSDLVNGERLYPVGAEAVHPKDGMPVHVRGVVTIPREYYVYYTSQ
ncbi:hypothetical protein HD806DRAFT_540752 [Xylariaceae sp. AK1471]|nr:hypothetical protein HD806DRAFT_540752 [Xylariaceae sp. AK1471]